MKNIYFVRHGETEYNKLHLSADEHDQLSENGSRQARLVAQRAKLIDLETIYASTMKRAVQTAGMIQEETGKEIIYSDILVEHRRPSEMLGHRSNGQMAAKINEECNLHQDDINWHYSDEENFLEYKVRAIKALEYLEGLPQKNILVVSHGNFIKMLVLTMALEDMVKPAILYAFANKLKITNTGITYCKKTEAGWSIEAVNDHQHLG
ncbi:MAG: histidine phosphatase family protein [Candidatus Paceibacterota bacterium]|nr:phosphoglycerate mutase family protein [Candidatus Omnitrophota bacterium]